ncbi:CarD family transcriptional regulator [Ammoniphilus sp. YIM 78166]|uniref:CarD family transcriptional regulator n=1 Tax=Ammoniphilus sp. YIM 78166 TaxID=1644106 RepID=UPI00196A4DB6|nr:CarD family transcriptional regulator [Ammoniphilus sp. YIM 78166]
MEVDLLFQIGDKIFYPMYGAGTVESIEEKEILGETQFYYILNMTLRNLQVMIPTKKASTLVIREVVGNDILENLLATFHHGQPNVTEDTHKVRQRINIDKIKSGDIFEGAEVIRDLTYLSKSKKLGMEDKMMLDNARQMLISELVLVKGLNFDQAARLIN